VTAAAALLEAMPDPAAVDEHWRRICREMVTKAAAAEYERGLHEGYLLAVADLKAWQHGVVQDAEQERRRRHLCCPRCRLAGHRNGCRDCETRTRETFGEPMAGDFPGREGQAA
jgi:hypothetical protein